MNNYKLYYFKTIEELKLEFPNLELRVKDFSLPVCPYWMNIEAYSSIFAGRIESCYLSPVFSDTIKISDNHSAHISTAIEISGTIFDEI